MTATVVTAGVVTAAVVTAAADAVVTAAADAVVAAAAPEAVVALAARVVVVADMAEADAVVEAPISDCRKSSRPLRRLCLSEFAGARASRRSTLVSRASGVRLWPLWGSAMTCATTTAKKKAKMSLLIFYGFCVRFKSTKEVKCNDSRLTMERSFIPNIFQC